MGKFKHLGINERAKIEVLTKEGYSKREIARILGRSVSTISRELARVRGEYRDKLGQDSYEVNRSNSIRKGKYNEEYQHIIHECFKKTYSPKQIVNSELKSLLSHTTIYRWIYKEKLDCGKKVLRQKGRIRRPNRTRGKMEIGRSIHDRPLIYLYESGHWELDSVLSGYNGKKECVATFLEKKSRKYIVIKMKDRTALSMIKAIKKALEEGAIIKSITCDRGKEFAGWREIEKLGIEVYFADAYAPYQRGANENANGLLREFYPKGTDFAKVSEENLKVSVELINNRPRECLGWKSANEVYYTECCI